MVVIFCVIDEVLMCSESLSGTGDFVPLHMYAP